MKRGSEAGKEITGDAEKYTTPTPMDLKVSRKSIHHGKIADV
jgi:hypothetical protein